jgi:hypothetical protein
MKSSILMPAASLLLIAAAAGDATAALAKLAPLSLAGHFSGI